MWFGEGPPKVQQGVHFQKNCDISRPKRNGTRPKKNVFLEKCTHSANISVRIHNQNHIVYYTCSSSGIQKVCGCAVSLNTTETGVWYLHTISFRPLSKTYKTRGSICRSWSAGRIPGKQNKNSLMLSTSSRKASVASCSIMFYSYWGLWSTLYVLSTRRKHLSFFFILKHSQFVFHVGVWFFDVFFWSAGRRALWCRKIWRVLPYGLCSSRGRKVKGKGHEASTRWTVWTLLGMSRIHSHCTNTGLCWPYQYENDDICVENSLKLKKSTVAYISDTRCRAHLTPRDILRLVATFFLFFFFRPWRMTTSFVWWRPVHLMCSRKASEEAWRAWWAWAFDIVWLNCSAIAPCDFAVSAWMIWTYLDISGYIWTYLDMFLWFSLIFYARHHCVYWANAPAEKKRHGMGSCRRSTKAKNKRKRIKRMNKNVAMRS